MGREACLEKLSADLLEQLIISLGSLPDAFIQASKVTLDLTDIIETSTLGDTGYIITAAVKVMAPKFL